MKDLPVAARVYVIVVLTIGAVLVAIFGPAALQNLRSFPLFLTLLLLSSFASALKVTLPLTASGSTMSVSYAVDFASLLLIGPDETMMVAATSALSQCLLNRKEQNPLHRTLFSMASLVVTVQAAGVIMRLLGDPDSTDPLSLMA